ncbi:MAG: YvcK family protein [Candidatus Solibacter usitatus]|nr:YvcK family protein [Candidatus Solibacter usitatus]
MPRLEKSETGEPLRILCIGGGTGLSTILQGLKAYSEHRHEREQHRVMPSLPADVRCVITAMVTVTDDGGSSGRLRRELGVLPPGDIRNCMVALSEDEALLGKLFQYRFDSGRGLKGHSFGNLFLTAMTKLTGDFAHAIQVSSEVLAIAGHIFPATASKTVLEATLRDGKVIVGESNISKSKARIEQIRLRPANPPPLEETMAAIASADLITLGPGSLFTSVIPNLLVDGIPAAIRKSKAVKAYFCNLMWQPGETIEYRASDHVEAIDRHAGGPLLDCVIVNTRLVTAPLQRKYAKQRALPVEADCDRLERMGLRIVELDLLADSDKARHDPARAAEIAMRLALMSRRRNTRASLLQAKSAKR